MDYLREKNCVLKEHLRGRRLQMNDDQRCWLAVWHTWLGPKGERLGGLLSYYYRRSG